MAILQGKRGATVLGVDPSQNMLEIGRGKVTEAGLDDVVKLELGDATSLQLNSSIYDKITISFGIRNIPDVDSALREMRRVSKQGALLGVLEFALPESGLLAPVARAFVSVVVPVLRRGPVGRQVRRVRRIWRGPSRSFPHLTDSASGSRPRASRRGNRVVCLRCGCLVRGDGGVSSISLVSARWRLLRNPLFPHG